MRKGQCQQYRAHRAHTFDAGHGETWACSGVGQRAPDQPPAPRQADECTCAMTEFSQRHCPLHGEDDYRQDDEQGLERRYLVRRLGDVEGRHRDCRFFVLDPQHDPIARTALAHYADDAGCPPELSRDLWRWLGEVTP